MLKPADKRLLKKLGAHLKMMREERNLSLREMSYSCNIDNSKISKIEKGQVNITFTTLVQLAEALEVEATELLDFDMG